ncbi:hypothetical protein TK45_07120 [Bowmanella sp. JS7-9]|nr:hypothetical protein TK45_07120 [Bowmanella sp. JS7-9]
MACILLTRIWQETEKNQMEKDMLGKSITKCSMLAAILVSMNVQASLVTLTFDNGDSLGDWSQDRTAPAGFTIVDNELVMSIDGSQATDGGFNDTHGMKLSVDGANYVAIDMFVSADWTNSERYAGFWGVGRDISDSISSYPILEFQGAGVNFPSAGIAIWDNMWAEISDLFTLDAFNRFALRANGMGVDYFLNGTKIYSETSSMTVGFSDIILNAKNDGNSFEVRYDNLTYGKVPEPAAWALMLTGLAWLGLRKKR